MKKPFRRPKTANELRAVFFENRFDPEISPLEVKEVHFRIRSRVELLAGREGCRDHIEQRKLSDRSVIELFESAQGTFPSLEEFERVLKKMAVVRFAPSKINRSK